MESTFSVLSIEPRTGADAPVEAAKVRMHDAVRKFEDSYTAYISSKAKSSPIPHVTLKQIVSSYDVTATNNNVSGRGDKFGKAVEQFLRESVVVEEPQPQTELGKKARVTKDSMSRYVGKVGDFMGKLLPLATVACGVAATVGDASLIASPLKAVANGTALVLQLAQRERDRGEELTVELDRISYQSRRVFEMQKQPRDSLNPLLLEKSLDLMTEIINFLASSLRYWKRGFFMNVTKSVLLGPEIWQSAIKALHLAYEEYDQALLIQIASNISMHQTQAKEYAQLPKKDDAFMEWLAPSSWEVEAQLVANRSQRANGTLGWVLELEQFRTWRVGDIDKSQPSSTQTLWITGLPGTGKSTISAYLYDLLVRQYRDDIFLHFFCKSGTPGLANAYNIVRTLCYQLTQKDDFYRRCLQDRSELPGTGQSKNLALLFRTLITEPLSKAAPESDIIIFLDGLDELEDTALLAGHRSYDNKTEIETLLEQLVLIPRAKLLITSRSSPELNRILSETGLTYNITWGDNSEDIRRYVQSRVGRSPQLANGFDQIGKDPVKLLGEKSNGIFLWAAVVLDMLERTISSKSFAFALEAMPPTMNHLYDQILDRAIQSGNYGWIKEILGWTLILPSSFTIPEMKAAVEFSMDDELFNMEDFLRSECGSFLQLVAASGSVESLEIHIGHETFQAYLTDPANSHSELFSANIAHGKAALACLRCLTSESSSVHAAFRLHALIRWRSYLRQSIGLGERGFAEQITALKAGEPLPPKLFHEILVNLYKFFTSHKIDKWLEHHLQNPSSHSEHPIFNELYYTCIEVWAWYRANKASLANPTALTVTEIDPQSVTDSCVWVPDLQCMMDALWPRACHVWLWNTVTGYTNVQNGYEALVRFDIWRNYAGISSENEEAVKLLKEEEQLLRENETRGYKMSGNLHGNLSLRYANSYLMYQNDAGNRSHFNAIAEAGGFDEMSGICQSNLSVACLFLSRRHNTDSAAELLQESLTRIQETLEEDPDGNPRHWEHLGYLYQLQEREELALDAWQTGIRIDAENLTGCRENYYRLRKLKLIDKRHGCLTPNYDAAISLLEEAIKEDPANANSQWFHQMADMYRAKGDLEGARRTYRANMEFDPSWNSQWEDLAETYIDKTLFAETREFDWRGYCDALADATLADPHRAVNHWEVWLSKAKELRGYQHFQTAVEMLEYGVERISKMKTRSAIQARPGFEFLLGETFCSMAKYNLAIPYLEDALRHLDDEPGLITERYKSLGHAYMFCGRYEDALAAFNKLIEKDPTDVLAYVGAGEVYLISGNPSKAIKEYKTAIRLQEKWAVERMKQNNYNRYSSTLDMYVGAWYSDLGAVYERLSRPDQARSCFEKALPNVQYAAHEATSRRTDDAHPQEVFVHRSEGRLLTKAAWLYERLDPRDKRAKENYELALWVFKTTVHVEDDFLEEAECAEVEAALARIERGEAWTFPGDEADRKLRERATARTYRINWGVNLERRKTGTRQSMMRGH